MKTQIVMGVVAATALALAGCSSDSPPPPAPSPQLTTIAPPVPTESTTRAVTMEGKPRQIGVADLTIHSFLANPETNSTSFRMNCYPLWRDVEKSKGQYDWSMFDLALNNQKAWGAQVLMYSFCGTPEWAADGSPDDPSVEVFGPKSSVPPKDLKYFEDYVRAVVKRYKGDISVYETWNEASSPQFWQGTPEQMVEMTKIVQRVVKEEDPQAQTTMASMQTHRKDYFNGFAVPYLQKLAAADWPFDIYNGHFYPFGEAGPAARRKQIDMFRAELAKLNAPPKELWDTEVNYYTGVPGGEPNGRITGDRAAAWAVRTYLDGWRKDVGRNYWYFATPTYNAFPGIQTTPGAPATRALSTFNDWVLGTKFNGCEQKPDYVNCSFTKNGEEVFIAWGETAKGDDTKNVRASYPLSGSAEVCHLPDGDCETTKSLTIDEVPVLIKTSG